MTTTTGGAFSGTSIRDPITHCGGGGLQLERMCGSARPNWDGVGSELDWIKTSGPLDAMVTSLVNT